MNARREQCVKLRQKHRKPKSFNRTPQARALSDFGRNNARACGVRLNDWPVRRVACPFQRVNNASEPDDRCSDLSRTLYVESPAHRMTDRLRDTRQHAEISIAT